MITTKEIKDFEFENINGIFDYVVDLVVNGKRDEAHTMIQRMSLRQKNWFAMYLEKEYPNFIVLR